jgi:hypothetical protein
MSVSSARLPSALSLVAIGATTAPMATMNSMR